MTIFLDHIAMLAAGNHHLLDGRYEALLREDEKPLVEQAQQLYVALAAMENPPPRWREMLELLRSLGAGMTS